MVATGWGTDLRLNSLLLCLYIGQNNNEKWWKRVLTFRPKCWISQQLVGRRVLNTQRAVNENNVFSTKTGGEGEHLDDIFVLYFHFSMTALRKRRSQTHPTERSAVSMQPLMLQHHLMALLLWCHAPIHMYTGGYASYLVIEMLFQCVTAQEVVEGKLLNPQETTESTEWWIWAERWLWMNLTQVMQTKARLISQLNGCSPLKRYGFMSFPCFCNTLWFFFLPNTYKQIASIS